MKIEQLRDKDGNVIKWSTLSPDEFAKAEAQLNREIELQQLKASRRVQAS